MPDSGQLPPLPDEVIAYLGRGFSVFPLKPGSKTPVINWKQFQSERLSKDRLASLARQHSDCNWAIVTGSISGLVVLDFDSQEALDRAQKRSSMTSRVTSYFSDSALVVSRKLNHQCWNKSGVW